MSAHALIYALLYNIFCLQEYKINAKYDTRTFQKNFKELLGLPSPIQSHCDTRGNVNNVCVWRKGSHIHN